MKNLFNSIRPLHIDFIAIPGVDFVIDRGFFPMCKIQKKKGNQDSVL